MTSLNEGKQVYKTLETATPIQLAQYLQEMNQKKQVKTLANLLSYIRKTGKSSTFQTHLYKDSLELISNNLQQLNSLQVSAYSFNLMRMKHKEGQEWTKLALHISNNPSIYSIRDLATIVFSFSYIQNSQMESSFQDFYRQLETTLAIKLVHSEHINGKDLTQILVGYSKSQTISQEFLYVLEQVSMQNFDKLTGREISEILLTLAQKNGYYSPDFSEKALQHFLKYASSYKVQELVHLLVGLHCTDKLAQEQKLHHQYQSSNTVEIREDSINSSDLSIESNLLTTTILQKFENEYLLRQQNCNILDTAHLAEVFFQLSYITEPIITLIRSQYKELRKNLDFGLLCKLLTNCDQLLNSGKLPHRFFKEMMKTLAIFVSTSDKVRGKNVKQLKLMAQNIEHMHFRELFFETLRGNTPTIYDEMEKKKQQEISDRDIQAQKKKRHFLMQAKKKQDAQTTATTTTTTTKQKSNQTNSSSQKKAYKQN